MYKKKSHLSLCGWTEVAEILNKTKQQQQGMSECCSKNNKKNTWLRKRNIRDHLKTL